MDRRKALWCIGMGCAGLALGIGAVPSSPTRTRKIGALTSGFTADTADFEKKLMQAQKGELGRVYLGRHGRSFPITGRLDQGRLPGFPWKDIRVGGVPIAEVPDVGITEDGWVCWNVECWHPDNEMI